MLKNAKRLIFPLAAAAALALPISAYAVDTGKSLVPDTLVNLDNIVVIIRGIIKFILVIAFVAAFIMLLIGGIRWITAGGDEKGVSAARNMITAALIGLVVVLVAYAIIKLVETFFGVNIISNNINIPTVGEQ